ncbi:MAG TPA: hypothetical protein VFH51_00175, partial [Myxococcota bacterium]|nr:hypothetical protein [Myxococcota bacterium]
RLLMSSLLWRQSRGSPGPGVCRAILVNQISGIPAQAAMLELYRPAWPGDGLWLVDDCDGRLRERLAGPWIAVPATSPARRSE